MNKELQNIKLSDWNTTMKDKIVDGVQLNKFIVGLAEKNSPVCLMTGNRGLFDGTSFICRLVRTKTVDKLKEFFNMLNPLIQPTSLNIKVSSHLHSIYSVTFDCFKPGEKGYFLVFESDTEITEINELLRDFMD